MAGQTGLCVHQRDEGGLVLLLQHPLLAGGQQEDPVPAAKHESPAAAEHPEAVVRQHPPGEGAVLRRHLRQMEPGTVFHESRQLLHKSRTSLEALLQL